VTIFWQSFDNVGVVSHIVRLSLDGGNTFTTIADNLPGNAQSFMWVSSQNQVTTQGRIRVVALDAAGNRGRDDSNANFAIF
jgi:hypothetical protein